MKKLIDFYQECKHSETSFMNALSNRILYRVQGKKFFTHQNVSIKGLSNMHTERLLRIGVNHVGFIHKTDKTYLNVSG